VSFDRLLDRQRLGDGQRQRLLAVDVLAGLERLDGHLRVPVVGRGDEHAIEGLVVDEVAEVLVLASKSLNPRWRITSVARRRWESSTSQPRVKVNCPAFTLGPDSLTTCKLRLCGLPMPTMPMTRRSLAGDFLAAPSSWAARSCRAYQVGSPAAASVPSEPWRKPRRE
jgi:hypothetical protein